MAILLGFFKDRDSNDLVRFIEPKPAREIGPGVFACELECTEVLEDGTERQVTDTWHVVPMPAGSELTGQIVGE